MSPRTRIRHSPYWTRTLKQSKKISFCSQSNMHKWSRNFMNMKHDDLKDGKRKCWSDLLQILCSQAAFLFVVLCIIMFHCLVFFGALGLFRSDILLIFNMVWPWFSRRTVCVCPQLPYRRSDVIFWIFPSVPCHVFCMWHWPIGKDFDLSFIWGHHLSEFMDISRPAEYSIACYTMLMRPNKVETAVHGCNCWLSVWTLSCRCPVKLFM